MNGDTWRPTPGSETRSLLERALSNDPERERVLREALGIFSHSPAPGLPNQQVTGLVLGYVQSGKTLSFTTVAALARDSRIRLVVVIAGTSIPLYQQSENRLLGDLRYNGAQHRRWAHFSNPRTSDTQSIQQILDAWRDPNAPAALKQTVLITVMKHSGRIRNLNAVLAALDLDGLPALIIDDEADQAGLNTLARQNRISATNRSILALRDAIPSHLYLEYTATPQALLLLQLMDSLSPQFAEVLDTGPDYVGLRDFFSEDNRLVQIIPANELPTPANALTSPPPTFLKALAVFFIGVTVGGERDDAIGNRSMLVHPSRLRDDHGDYHQWAVQLRGEWLEALLREDGHPERIALISLFREAYEDLQATDGSLPPFEQIVPRLSSWISRTEILEVNTRRGGRTPTIDWDRSYAYILVGGQAMDRGFTVRGLTVTYMPRSLGVGNADVIQQRARFLGYKRGVLPLCRVFIAADVAQAYRDYEVHESSVRDALQAEGGNLREWRRRFLLDPNLEPTRRTVYTDPLVRGVAREDWTAPRYAHLSEAASTENRLRVDRFIANHPFSDVLYGHRAKLDMALETALAQLLVEYRLVDQGDAQRFQALLLSLRAALDRDADITCDLMEMVRQDDGAPRERSTTSSGSINQLFQGRRPKTGPAVYVGDNKAHRDNRVTIQIHHVDIKIGQNVAHRDVPYIAVFLPSGIARVGLDHVEQPGNILPAP